MPPNKGDKHSPKGTFRSRRTSNLSYGGNAIEIHEKFASVIVSTRSIIDDGGQGFGSGNGESKHGTQMNRLFGVDKYNGKGYSGLFTNYTDRAVIPDAQHGAIVLAVQAGWNRNKDMAKGMFYDYKNYREKFVKKLDQKTKDALKNDCGFDVKKDIERDDFNKDRHVRRSKTRRNFEKYAREGANVRAEEAAFVASSPFTTRRRPPSDDSSSEDDDEQGKRRRPSLKSASGSRKKGHGASKRCVGRQGGESDSDDSDDGRSSENERRPSSKSASGSRKKGHGASKRRVGRQGGESDSDDSDDGHSSENEQRPSSTSTSGSRKKDGASKRCRGRQGSESDSDDSDDGLSCVSSGRTKYQSQPKLKDTRASNRDHLKGSTENEDLCIPIEGTGPKELTSAMSLEQVSDFLKEATTSRTAPLGKLEHDLTDYWSALTHGMPLLVGDFVTQVANSAAEGGKSQINLHKLAKQMGSTGQDAKTLVLGEKCAAEYSEALRCSSMLGGCGSHGGPSDVSSIPRQQAGARAGLDMAAAAVAVGGAHYTALCAEKKKMPDLDQSTLDYLGSALPEPPARPGADARSAQDDHLEAKDAREISPSSIFSETFTGSVFLDEGVVFKVVGCVVGPYYPTEDDDSYANTMLALELGKASFVRKKLAGSGLLSVRALLRGTEVDGVTWPFAPRVTSDMNMTRLVRFVNFTVRLVIDTQRADICLTPFVLYFS